MATIKSCRPNGHFLSLLQDPEGYYFVQWVIQDTDDDDETIDKEFSTLPEAEKFYEEMRKELNDTPNWYAQARYDEAHGTDNGYGPHHYHDEY